MAKLNFQQPLLQSSVSHDPSESILICRFGVQEPFLIIIVDNSCTAEYFYANCDTFLFRIDQNLFEIEIVCAILLNKSSLKIIILTQTFEQK